EAAQGQDHRAYNATRLSRRRCGRVTVMDREGHSLVFNLNPRETVYPLGDQLASKVHALAGQRVEPDPFAVLPAIESEVAHLRHRDEFAQRRAIPAADHTNVDRAMIGKTVQATPRIGRDARL